MQERRQFSRVAFQTTALLQQDQHQWPCQLLDLSLRGALTSRPDNWAGADSPLTLSFRLASDLPAIRMQVEVVSQQDDSLHLRCLQLDLDSLAQLRRLIELNLADEDSLNRQVEQLVDLRQP